VGVLAAINRPWWEWVVVIVPGAIVLGFGVILLSWSIGDWFSTRKYRKQYDQEYAGFESASRDALAFPYYLDQQGIRSLASSLKIDIPLTRHVTKSRKLSALFKGVGGETGRSETAQYAGQLDLVRLSESISEADPSKVTRYLGVLPQVSDREVLAEAVVTAYTDSSFHAWLRDHASDD
jgi:hypothetical protein